jgi:hypothetical protein
VTQGAFSIVTASVAARRAAVRTRAISSCGWSRSTGSPVSPWYAATRCRKPNAFPLSSVAFAAALCREFMTAGSPWCRRARSTTNRALPLRRGYFPARARSGPVTETLSRAMTLTRHDPDSGRRQRSRSGRARVLCATMRRRPPQPERHLHGLRSQVPGIC